MSKTNIVKVSFACAVILSMACCTSQSDVQGTADVQSYFSLENYFQQEASRLQQHAPEIAKTVSKDGETESHNLRIGNWENEFALFIDSDINKAAWQNSYRIDSTATALVYTSLDPALRTEQIAIRKQADGTVEHIRITNRVNNMLYRTTEQLDYYPDSLYRITKQQRVRVIGESEYVITGTFQ